METFGRYQSEKVEEFLAAAREFAEQQQKGRRFGTCHFLPDFFGKSEKRENILVSGFSVVHLPFDVDEQLKSGT